MRVGQVRHMDIVAHRGAVLSRIVGAENLQRRPAPKRRLDRERDQMRLGIVVLADLALRVGSPRR